MMVLSGLGASLGILEIMSAIGSLVVVILVIVLAFVTSRWYARKISGGGFSGGGRHIKVIDRIGLGQAASLTIVKVGETYYFVGVSDRNIQLLCELPDYERFIGEASPPGSPEPFAAMLRSFIDKTKAGHPKTKSDEGGPNE